MSTRPHAYLFCDGSSSRGDDVGGWAAIAVCGDNRRMLWGVTFPTTISRCELTPMVEGLRWIKTNWSRGTTGFRVAVYSDSEFVVKTCASIYPRGEKNIELWAALDVAARGMRVDYRWRERNSTPYMEICDHICGNFRRHMIEQMKTLAADPRAPELSMPVMQLPDEAEPPKETA